MSYCWDDGSRNYIAVAHFMLYMHNTHLWSTLAPYFRSSWATSRWPFLQARWSGLSPSSFSLPAEITSTTSWPWLFSLSSSRSRTLTCPFRYFVAFGLHRAQAPQASSWHYADDSVSLRNSLGSELYSWGHINSQELLNVSQICSIGLLGSKVISAILSRYVALTAPTN